MHIGRAPPWTGLDLPLLEPLGRRAGSCLRLPAPRPKKTQADLDKFIATYSGKYQGKIILLSDSRSCRRRRFSFLSFFLDHLFKRDPRRASGNVKRPPTTMPRKRINEVDSRTLQCPENAKSDACFFARGQKSRIDQIFDAVKRRAFQSKDSSSRRGVVAGFILTREERCLAPDLPEKRSPDWQVSAGAPRFPDGEQYNRICTVDRATIRSSTVMKVGVNSDQRQREGRRFFSTSSGRFTAGKK